jgi:hypothetical protein
MAFSAGAPSARKALFEALIQEIKVHSNDSITPIVKLADRRERRRAGP